VWIGSWLPESVWTHQTLLGIEPWFLGRLARSLVTPTELQRHLTGLLPDLKCLHLNSRVFYCVYVFCVLLTLFILIFDVFIVCMKSVTLPQFSVLNSYYIWNLLVFFIIFRSLSIRVCLFMWDCLYRTAFIAVCLIFWMLNFLYCFIHGYLYLFMYFLGAFAKLRIATISFVTSVLSVLPHGTIWIPTESNFYETWYLRIFRKSVKNT
jgi:hypothetical protein